MIVCFAIYFYSLTTGIRVRLGFENNLGEERSAPGITKSNGSDYVYWWMQIEDYLFIKKLHLLLGTKLEGMKVNEWNLLDS